MGEVTRPGCNSRCGGKLGEYRYRIERMGRRLLVTLQGFRHFCFKRSLPLPVFFFFQHVTLYLLKFLLFGHAVRNVGLSSLTRDQTHAPCIGCVVLTLDWKFPFPPLLFFTGGCLATGEMCWGKDLGERER